jgi:hypothetical protein
MTRSRRLALLVQLALIVLVVIVLLLLFQPMHTVVPRADGVAVHWSA